MPLRLYDIMAEEMTLWAKKLSSGEIEVRVEDENDNEVYNHISHRFAWDELVYFAKQVLRENERMERDEQD